MKRLARSVLVVATVLTVVVLVLVASSASRIDESGEGATINLGTPADSAGLLGSVLDGVSVNGGSEIVAYPLKDCCTTKTEYALSVDLLDAALLCPDAAERLVERDARYVRVGAVVMNSDVLVARGDGQPIVVVAVGVNRDYQVQIAREQWGAAIDVRPTLSSVISLAVADGEVDAAVVDLLDARALVTTGSDVTPVEGDVVSYELVVTRDFAVSDEYATFLDQMGDAAESLNRAEVFSSTVRSWTGTAMTKEEVDLWRDSKMCFVRPSP